MPMENDLGSGNDFDMDSALAQMSEGMGFSDDESGAPASADTDPELSITDQDLAAAETAAAKTAAGAVAASDVTALQSATPEAPAAAAAPKTWRKEAAELWPQLPPQIQAEVQKREDDMFRGLEAYKADAGFGRSLRGALDPYMPVLQQYGIDPAQQISSLMQAHHTLALGSPQDKQALFRQLAQDYGVDLGQVADPSGAPFVDPSVAALQSELHAVKSHLQAQTRQAEQAKIGELTKQIESFAADPKNGYFNDVANDMVTLLQSGAVKTLEEAYEKAVWSNPATRAKELERQTAERVQKQREEAAKRAAEAKRASSVVIRPQARRASGTAPTGSLDDTLRETLAEINSRSS